MKKEIRAELRGLKFLRRQTLADFKGDFQQARREQVAAQKEIFRLQNTVDKNLGKLDRRIAILQGRLS